MTAGSFRQRCWRSRGWLADAVPSVLLVGFALIQIWLPDYAPGVEQTQGSKAVQTITALLATAPVFLRRRYPLVAFTMVLGGMAL